MAVPFYLPDEDEQNHQQQQQQQHQQQQQQQRRYNQHSHHYYRHHRNGGGGGGGDNDTAGGGNGISVNGRNASFDGSSSSNTASTSSSSTSSSSSSATQTPLQSPVNSDHLVQAIYEALYLLQNSVSVAGTPSSLYSPPSSPSCNRYHGNVFFARSMPRSPRAPRLDDYNISGRSQQHHHHHHHHHTPNMHFQPSRARFNSTGTDIDDEEYGQFESVSHSSSTSSVGSSSSSSSSSSSDGEASTSSSRSSYHSSIEEQLSVFMQARESLPEFTGPLPIKKKSSLRLSSDDNILTATTTISSPNSSNRKNNTVTGYFQKSGETTSTPKPKSKDQKFVWPTVVGAVVLAVGCGFLATR